MAIKYLTNGSEFFIIKKYSKTLRHVYYNAFLRESRVGETR